MTNRRTLKAIAIATVSTTATVIHAAALPVQAYPVWTAQDDLEFVRNFATSFQASTGYAPSDELIGWSLNCVKTTYTQAASSGVNPNIAVNNAISVCGQALQQAVGGGNRGGGRSNTLFNSSGDASLSTDSNGCNYFSSGSISYSTC